MKLFEPLDIRGMVIPNRIMVPAMVTHLCHEDGHATEDTINRYERYAQGGAGLIVVEAMAIHSVKSGPLLRISSNEYLPGLKRLTQRVHAAGESKLVPQLIHFLKVSRSGWRQTVDMVEPQEIDAIVEQFGEAAARAREAGFDGVELHSAHAYTLSSFLSRTNPRTDAYTGRTLEGRLLLISRVIESVRRLAGPDFPVGVRFNAEEFIKSGYTVQESKLIALRLAQLGVDYLSLSAGGKFEDAVHTPGKVLYPYSGYSGDRCMPGDWFPRGLHVPIAQEIRSFLRAGGYAVPVGIAGKLSDPQDAEDAVSLGRADIVGIARGLLADPDWPHKVRRGELDAIVHCDYCNICKTLDGNHKTVVCGLWPQGALQAPATCTGEQPPEWDKGEREMLQAEAKDGRVSLHWKKAKDATHYEIYRIDGVAGPRLVGTVKTTRLADTAVAPGTPYWYYVRACSGSGLASKPSNKLMVELPVQDLGLRPIVARAPVELAGFVPWPQEFAKRYREAGYWEGITLFQMLERSAARFPDKIAVVDGERRVTYTELVAYSEQLARAFLKAGLRPGERIVFQLANGLEMLASFFGLVRIGVIPVLALPAHRHTEIAHYVRNAGAVAYLIPDVVRGFDYRDMAFAVSREVESLRSVIVFGEAQPGQVSVSELLAKSGNGGSDLHQIKPASGDVAFMVLSGGTTGLPKLIPRTHDDYVYNARVTGEPAGFSADTVYLAILPMSHNFTLGCPGVCGALVKGGRVVIAPANDLDTVCSLIERERVTVVATGVPLVARWLAEEGQRKYDLRSLRVLMNGGAKLVPELRRRVEERFGCTYVESFGCGEGLINSTRLEDPEPVRYESSGRPSSPADEIRILDDADRDVPDGELGELCCRGPYTIRGYYDSPVVNATAFTADGFYRMGDIVKRVQGNFYLMGRKKDLINRGGEKISSEEVENFILAHPKVQSVCVVAMPDPVFGEKACAFVILREGCSLDFKELVSFLLSRGIAKFKMPERLEIVTDFPISAAGKILRRDLRELIAQKIASERAA